MAADSSSSCMPVGARQRHVPSHVFPGRGAATGLAQFRRSVHAGCSPRNWSSPADVALFTAFQASRFGLPGVAQSHRHGLHAHAARDARSANRADRALLCRAGQGRRRAHRHRRFLAQCRGPDGARRPTVRQPRADRRASPDNAGGACRGRQNCAADPACRALRQGRRRCRTVGHRLADQSASAAAHERGRHRAHHCGLRRHRRARPRGRLRRRRDHGKRGLPHQRVHGPAQQSSHRRLGWQPGEPLAPARGDHGRRAPEGRPRFPCHLPGLLDRSRAGRADRGGDRGRGASRRGCRRRHHQPGYRLARGARADHCPEGAASGLGVCGAASEGCGEDPRDRVEPHQHARGRRGDPGSGGRRSRVDGAADAGRPRVRQQGAGRPRRRDQRVHRLQPGLPRFHFLRPRGELPRQPEGWPRNRVRRGIARRAPSALPLWAQVPRASPAPSPQPSADTP